MQMYSPSLVDVLDTLSLLATRKSRPLGLRWIKEHRHEYSLAHHHRFRCGNYRQVSPSWIKERTIGLHSALGIGGSFVATYLGQALGWYKAGEGAGFIGAVVGAIIVLVVWGIVSPKLQR